MSLPFPLVPSDDTVDDEEEEPPKSFDPEKWDPNGDEEEDEDEPF